MSRASGSLQGTGKFHPKDQHSTRAAAGGLQRQHLTLQHWLLTDYPDTPLREMVGARQKEGGVLVLASTSQHLCSLYVAQPAHF